MLDRALQRRMLEAMQLVYPDRLRVPHDFEGVPKQVATVNLAYLFEHDLVVMASTATVDGLRVHNAGITAKGLDFLADDGGLSAILGVVTVKLHEDTLKALLIDAVQASPSAPATVKSKLIDQIKALPAEATKAVTLEGLKAGLSQMPDVAAWLQKLLPL